MDIYIVRHGQSTNNSKQGEKSVEPLLSDRGIKQAECVGKRLSCIDFDYIFVSPLYRTAATAYEITRRQKKNHKLLFMNELMEIGTAAGYCGMEKEKLSETIGFIEYETVSDGFIPFAETQEEIFQRAKYVLNYLKENCGEADKILLVTHGTYARSLLWTFLEIENTPIHFTQSNCCIDRVRLTDGEKPRMDMMNDTRHIPKKYLSEAALKELY